MDMVRPAVELRQQIMDWISQQRKQQPATPRDGLTQHDATPRDELTQNDANPPEKQFSTTVENDSAHNDPTPTGDTPQDRFTQQSAILAEGTLIEDSTTPHDGPAQESCTAEEAVKECSATLADGMTQESITSEEAAAEGSATLGDGTAQESITPEDAAPKNSAIPADGPAQGSDAEAGLGEEST